MVNHILGALADNTVIEAIQYHRIISALTSIIGINDQFRPDYKNKNLKIQDHLVIDLDKGDIHLGLDDNNNNVNENNKKINKLIKRICDGNEDEKTKKKIFYQAIKNLKKHKLG